MSADITEERIAKLRRAIESAEQGGESVDSDVARELLDALLSARSQLAALQSVPQGVEVPEMPVEDLLECLVYKLDSPTGLLKDCPMDEEYSAQRITEWFRARLAPTPPQAAPETVDVVLNPPKQDKDCGDCTRLAICNGELACLCGPTGRMFDRKEPDHPLQPEERRVGPDEVAVDRDYLADLEESVIDTVEQLRVGFVLCENCGEQESTDTLDVMSMNLLPMIPRIEERRTSAQDHNGEGATAHCGTCAQSGHCVDAKWRVVCDDYLALQAPGQRGEG